MRRRIRIGWRSASVCLVVISCAARSDEDPGFVQEPGTAIGELVVRIADFADGQSETLYVLRNAEGSEQRLILQDPPGVEPGTQVKVWGRRGADGIVADKLETVPLHEGTLGSISPELIHPTPQAPRIFCAAVVAINNAPVPASLTVPTVEDVFHAGAKSANAYIVENSYGRNSFGGMTYGPFSYSMSGCDYAGLRDAVRPMIPDKCDHYGYVLAPNQKSCAWAGIGDEGTAAKPQSDTWYNAIDVGTIVQENGHNMGLNHASSITCTGGPFADDLSGCKHDEYGDHFDTMGLGERHMHVWPKLYMGWFGGCNFVKVTSSGTFNLLPIEAACDGVQAIQIPFPGGKTRPFQAGGNVTLTSYYLEYRSSLGFDTGMTPQVFLHAAANPLTANTKSNPHSWLLNASGNSKNPGLVSGGSFSDPAGGLTISVTAIDSQKATVQIDYPGGTGEPTCMDGTILTSPGPVDCVGATTADGGPAPLPDGGMAGSGGSRDGGTDAGAGGRAGGGGAASGGRDGASGGPPDAGASGSAGGSTSSGGAGGAATSGSGGAVAGSAGSPPAGGAGVGGSSVGVGGSNSRAGASELDGGCSCRVGAPASSRGSPAMLALGLAFLVARRRGRPRQSQEENTL